MLRSFFNFLRRPVSGPAAITPVPIPKNGVDYRGKVVLAPMVRSGELPSRLLALKYGADLVWGPETIDRAMIGSARKHNPQTSTIDFTRTSTGQLALPPELRHESIIYSIHPALESRRLIFQLGTANPALAVEAALLVAPDVAGIDVNAGCPKPFSTTGGMGAALLKTPDKLVAILEALVEQVGKKFEIGISVKIRLLHTPEETEALVKRLVRTGITGLTIHCRTAPMRKTERAIREQLRMVVQTCHDAGVACVMNGDVESRAHAQELMAEYGADGAMIAIAAEKNSSVFRPEGPLPWDEVTKEYIRTAMRVQNKWGNTKFLLGQLIPGKKREYQELMPCRCYSAACEVVGMTDEADVELARRTDEALRIPHGAGKETKSEKKDRVRETKEMHKKAAQAFANGEWKQQGQKQEQQQQTTKRPATEDDQDPATSKRVKMPEVPLSEVQQTQTQQAMTA